MNEEDAAAVLTSKPEAAALESERKEVRCGRRVLLSEGVALVGRAREWDRGDVTSRENKDFLV